MLNPETNEDEEDNVVVTDTDEKQLKHGEVLTRGRKVGRVAGDSHIVSSKGCLNSLPIGRRLRQ